MTTEIIINATQTNNIKESSHKIYRYKISEECITEIIAFSNIHKYDNRLDFKEAWTRWCETNNDLISTEIRRLTALGYTGNVEAKMFKSARYYFRTKSPILVTHKLRRSYITLNTHILAHAMDIHITKHMGDAEYQPKHGFTSFCQSNKEELTKSIREIVGQGITDIELITEKIKKTYKNRYFILTNK